MTLFLWSAFTSLPAHMPLAACIISSTFRAHLERKLGPVQHGKHELVLLLLDFGLGALAISQQLLPWDKKQHTFSASCRLSSTARMNLSCSFLKSAWARLRAPSSYCHEIQGGIP